MAHAGIPPCLLLCSLLWTTDLLSPLLLVKTHLLSLITWVLPPLTLSKTTQNKAGLYHPYLLPTVHLLPPVRDPSTPGDPSTRWSFYPVSLLPGDPSTRWSFYPVILLPGDLSTRWFFYPVILLPDDPSTRGSFYRTPEDKNEVNNINRLVG